MTLDDRARYYGFSLMMLAYCGESGFDMMEREGYTKIEVHPPEDEQHYRNVLRTPNYVWDFFNTLAGVATTVPIPNRCKRNKTLQDIADEYATGIRTLEQISKDIDEVEL